MESYQNELIEMNLYNNGVYLQRREKQSITTLMQMW